MFPFISALTPSCRGNWCGSLR